MHNFDVADFWDKANKRLDAVIAEFPLQYDILDEAHESTEAYHSDEWYEEGERWEPYQNGQIV